jgi:hypothetical protein
MAARAGVYFDRFAEDVGLMSVISEPDRSRYPHEWQRRHLLADGWLEWMGW